MSSPLTDQQFSKIKELRQARNDLRKNCQTHENQS